MKRTIFIIIVLSIFVLPAFVVYYSQPKKKQGDFALIHQDSANREKTLRIAFNAPPMTLDPRKSGDFISSTLICLIYEGLTRCLPGGDVEPAIASQIDISSDALVYTFHLRRSFWSDGHPVTAQDFETSWKQILKPSFPSLSSYLLFPIKNAERYAKGEVLASDVAITAIDPYTLRVELERPAPYFLSLTAFPLFLPVPSHLSEVDEANPVCNGPFCIGRFALQTGIHLIKNEKFWNPDKFFLQAISISIVPDENTVLRLFEEGELDWIGAPHVSLPPDALPSLEERVEFIPMAASTFCTFNTTQAPFDHYKFRKALILALNREELIDKVALKGQIYASRILPPALFRQPPLKPLIPSYDPEQAKILFNEVLAELGIISSAFRDIRLCYKTGQVNKRIAQAMQYQWKEVLGLHVTLEQLDPKIYIEKLHKRNYQIALASWISQFNDPINLLERYRLSSNPKNFAGWQNEEFANFLQQAELQTDLKERFHILEQAEEIFASETPVFPLYHWAGLSLKSSKVQSVPQTPCGGILFERFVLRD